MLSLPSNGLSPCDKNGWTVFPAKLIILGEMHFECFVHPHVPSEIHSKAEDPHSQDEK